MYLAHRSEDGRKQTILEHLSGTAALCKKFAARFCAAEQGELAGLAHDLGKYSEQFQRRLHGGPAIDHATAGAAECWSRGQLPAALAIAGHHGGIPDLGAAGDTMDESTLYGRAKRWQAGMLPDYSPWKDEITLPSHAALPAFFDTGLLTQAFYTRMLYSCLVDADFLDTEQFMQNGAVERSSGEPLPVLLEKLENHIAPFWPPRTPLNESRCQVLSACLEGGAEDKGLYTLTVPTGGGKTIASLAFALRHAVHHGMDRVIYVIPYTSIIEQNAAVFRDILGEENVVEHHSGVVFDGDRDLDERGYRQALASENWDAPVIVTTAVQFFESLYSNKPSKCRKLHNLADSVLIFDEAQMLPGEHLRPCVSAIAQLVRHYGATAVLCTATQPALNDLFAQYTGGLPIRELCHDPAALYDRLRRVTFRDVGTVTTEALADQLAELPQVLCVVNSRKAARTLFDLLPPEGSYHLSTLMYPAHRRRVLAEIRQRLTDGLPCRVVSTSLIEAGVDVDFPEVWRELAGLDSIVQAAGRCNREGKRAPEDSIVTIFKGDWLVPPIFGMSIGAAEEALSGGRDPGNPETIQRYFRSWRSLAGETLDQFKVLDAFERGISGCMMPFRTVAENFHLIQEATRTVYIPLDEGAEYADCLLRGACSRALLRKAGQYSVSVYERHFMDLLESGGAIRLEDGESAVLTDSSLYQEMTGLSLEMDWGKGNFI